MKNKDVFLQILRVFLGEVVLVLLMLGVYALLDKLSPAVLLGAGLGALIAIGNFIALSISVSLAADRAANTGDAKKAQLALQSGTILRMLVLAGLYILILKSGKCDPIATVLPLLLVQMSLRLTEFFRKDGEK